MVLQPKHCRGTELVARPLFATSLASPRRTQWCSWRELWLSCRELAPTETGHILRLQPNTLVCSCEPCQEVMVSSLISSSGLPKVVLFHATSSRPSSQSLYIQAARSLSNHASCHRLPPSHVSRLRMSSASHSASVTPLSHHDFSGSICSKAVSQQRSQTSVVSLPCVFAKRHLALVDVRAMTLLSTGPTAASDAAGLLRTGLCS